MHVWHINVGTHINEYQLETSRSLKRKKKKTLASGYKVKIYFQLYMTFRAHFQDTI